MLFLQQIVDQLREEMLSVIFRLMRLGRPNRRQVRLSGRESVKNHAPQAVQIKPCRERDYNNSLGEGMHLLLWFTYIIFLFTQQLTALLLVISLSVTSV